MKKEIGLGLLGFGVVGSGVVKTLKKNGRLIQSRTGLNFVLRKIADLDLDSDRGVKISPAILTRDADSVVNDPDIDIVIELIGGVQAARDLMTKALKLGKPVITANKALLAEYGDEMFSLAEEYQTDVFFEASVGGGMPLLRSLRESLVSNRIRSIFGILNGTCNYILTRMEQTNMNFDDLLKEAQKVGYAESDPSLDIDGVDTAHKAVILASLAYGFHIPMSAVAIEGIRAIDAVDIQYAEDLGYRIKMLAVIKDVNRDVEVRVHPALIPVDHIMASVSGVFNAVMLDCDGAGDVLCYGKGAGRNPTASAVLSDVVDAGRNLMFHSQRRTPGFVSYNSDCRIRDIGEAEVRYYMRLTLLDHPGVFGQIGSVLGRNGISIASVLQKESRIGEQVPVIIITHYAKEKAFCEAMKELDTMIVTGTKTVRYRIEDFQLDCIGISK